MSLTVHVGESRAIEVTERTVEAPSGEVIEFAVDGVLRVSESILGQYAGRSLRPQRIDVSVDGGTTVEVDLAGDAILDLATVDVGVETPGVEEVASGLDQPPGRVSFALEGTISGLPTMAVETIVTGSPRIESVTFAVDDPVRGDGGAPGDPLLEVVLLGFTVVVRRNGAIEVSRGTGREDVGLP